MKSSQHLISVLAQDFPNLAQKIQQHQEILRFKNIFFTPHIKEQILFITRKEDKLLFAFKHQALCAEFNHYKHKQIIESLKQYKEQFPTLCTIQKIHAYVPSHILASSHITLKPHHTFFEHSNGMFENRAKNNDIYKKFEEIRLSIQRIKALDDE